MTEREDLTIPTSSDNVTLSATVCLPNNNESSTTKFPVVLMIHGSGPLDRNENMPRQKLDVFNTIAQYLANDCGVASVRYDKRGCAKSTGDYDTAGHDDLVQDAIACVDFVKQQEFCNQLYVLGHSEGSIIAPQVSAKRPTDVAGILLLCPFLSNLEDVMVKQAHQVKSDLDNLSGFSGMVFRGLKAIHLAPDPIQQQKKALDKVKASPDQDVIRLGLLQPKLQAKWLRELMAIEPKDIYEQVTCPTLVIGGEKDLQCSPAEVSDIVALLNKTKDVESHVLPNLSHLLRIEEQKASFLRYPALLKEPLAPIVLDHIGQWLKPRVSNDD